MYNAIMKSNSIYKIACEIILTTYSGKRGLCEPKHNNTGPYHNEIKQGKIIVRKKKLKTKKFIY